MAKKMFATEPDVFGPFRLSFPDVFVPRAAAENAPEKYAITMLFPKDKSNILPEVAYFKGEMDLRKLAYAALTGQWGKDRTKWPGTMQVLFGNPQTGNSNLQTYLSPTGKDGWPFRDGDHVADKYDGYADHIFVRATSFRVPGVVDNNTQRIMDPNSVYGGLICLAQVNAYCYEAGGTPGVTFGLNHLQILKDDGVSFTSMTKAEDAFASYPALGGAASNNDDAAFGDAVFGGGQPEPSKSDVGRAVSDVRKEATSGPPPFDPDDNIPF